MWQKIKDEFQSRPKAFSGMFLLLLILLVFALWQLSPYMPVLWPSKELIDGERAALMEAQAGYQEQLDRALVLIRNQESLLARANDYWLERRDGNAELEIQKRIDEAAKDGGLSLASVGNIQTEKLGDGANLMSINVAAQGEISQILGFIAALEQASPRFYWRMLQLRPDNVRKPEKVVLNGVIEFISITDDDTVTFILEEL